MDTTRYHLHHLILIPTSMSKIKLLNLIEMFLYTNSSDHEKHLLPDVKEFGCANLGNFEKIFTVERMM